MTLFKSRTFPGRAWRAADNNSAARSRKSVTLKPYHSHAGRRWWQLAAFAFFCTMYGIAFALFAPGLMGLLAAPVAVLGAMVIWALPDTSAAPTGLIEPLFFAYFGALVMWPNYLAIGLPGLPWITLNRLIQFPLAGLTLISVSMSRQFRSDLATILASASPVWKMISAFVAVQVLTLVFSKQFGLSVQTVIIHQINCTMTFFVGCYVFSKSSRISFWFYLIWVTAVGVSIVGTVEHYQSRVLWAGHVPSFLKINDPVIDAILNGGIRGGVHRVQATFGTSLTLAEYLALATPFIIHIAVTGSRLIVRTAAAATVPVVLYTILVTESRLGVIGVLLGSLTYLLYWAGSRWRRNRKSVFGPAVSLAFPLIFVLAIMSTFFVGRLHAVVWGNGVQTESNDSRAAEWATAIPKILENPLGHGAGTGGGVLNYIDFNGLPTIDSYYMSILLEYGILGALLYYGVILCALYLCAKMVLKGGARNSERSLLVPIAASMVAFLFTRSVLSEIDNNPIVFALMALVVALAYRLNKSTPVSTQADPAQAGSGHRKP